MLGFRIQSTVPTLWWCFSTVESLFAKIVYNVYISHSMNGVAEYTGNFVVQLAIKHMLIIGDFNIICVWMDDPKDFVHFIVICTLMSSINIIVTLVTDDNYFVTNIVAIHC